MSSMKTCALAITAALVAASGADAQQVVLSADLDRPAVRAGRTQRAFLRVNLRGQALDGGPRERAPVNVAIVLDRSGSMQGAKLEAAKEAAIAAIRRLDERDFVSVVAYDSTVQTIWRSQRLTNPQAAERAVRSIRARGNTALFAGVSRGARELRRTWSRDRVNRIVLLSDGLANVGPSSPGALARLGRSLAREGITVTTLGLGLSYNEDLMSQLAAASDGSHAFIEREAELARIFDAEFGDILSVVAQDVNVDVEFVGDARPIRVLGREAYISDGRVRTRLNQIFGEQDKYIVVEVELPPIALDAQRTIAEVSVNYHDLGSRSTRQDRRSVNVTGTDSPAVIEARSNRDVLVIVSDLLAAEEIEQAVALNDQGRIDEAERVLQRSAARLGRDAQRYNSRRLRRRSATQMRAAPELRRRPSRARRALRADQNQAIFNRAY